MNKGSSRGAIVIRGSDQVPATDITLSNFNMWTVNGNTVINQCKNVYGSGYCAGKSTGLPLATFTTSVTSTAAPAGFTAPASPAWGVAGYGTNIPIPVYTPAALWKPVSSGVAGSSVVASTSKVSVAAVQATLTSVAASTKKTSFSSVKATSTTLKITVPVTSSAKSSVKTSSTLASVVKTSSTAKAAMTSSAVGSIAKYGQCGGSQWTGATGCVAGSTCVFQSQWYSQCL